MDTPISIKAKKNFIRWFLEHYQLKKLESEWILNHFLQHEEILSNIHFVREARFCPRAIILTSECAQGAPFRFYKRQLSTANAEKAFHDIRLNRDESLYIQVNFWKSNQNPVYASVLEENPCLPDDYFITTEDKAAIQNTLDQSLYIFKRNKLLKGIDQALDEMDREKFEELSYLLNQLESSMELPTT